MIFEQVVFSAKEISVSCTYKGMVFAWFSFSSSRECCEMPLVFFWSLVCPCFYRVPVLDCSACLWICTFKFPCFLIRNSSANDKIYVPTCTYQYVAYLSSRTYYVPPGVPVYLFLFIILRTVPVRSYVQRVYSDNVRLVRSTSA
jgi:hypothetical protein